MNKRILLGIDTTISPATQHVIHTVSEFIEEGALSLHLILLNVIPVPYAAPPAFGMHVHHLLSTVSITIEQRSQAEDCLRKARTELQKSGIAPDHIEVLIRAGIPSDEIVKAAKELHVSFIVVGSRGNALRHRIRRFFSDSISRKVLQSSPCPVMIVTPRLVPHPTDLVTWYEAAITTYLQENTSSLSVFTPREVAQKFLPPQKKAAKRKEIAAATIALEQLSSSGVLCRHDVKGELRYVND
jgi:nucleotide-binding universal stress UspA family protein